MVHSSSFENRFDTVGLGHKILPYIISLSSYILIPTNMVMPNIKKLDTLRNILYYYSCIGGCLVAQNTVAEICSNAW